MGTFDNYRDSPSSDIKTEGQEITLNFTRLSNTTGRISWNIPPTAAGCTDSDSRAYNGIVVTLNTIPADLSQTPSNGHVYQSDPTGDKNLHAGDKIGTSLVVGAFYNDLTTTTMDVSGLSPNVPYYISAYAVDNVYRYHKDGVHAYNLNWGSDSQGPTSGYQVIDISAQPTDPTGFVSTEAYTVTLNVDGKDYPITVNGADAPTYADLIDALNKQFALLANAPNSAGVPDVNTLFWDNTAQKLYKWNGSQNVEQYVIVDSTDPSVATVGEYWLNTTTTVLSQWDGLLWVAQSVITASHDPTEPECDDYWYTGTAVYKWDGVVWCPKNLYQQATDPSLPPTLTCPLYWYDSANEHLYEWNDENLVWDDVLAIMFPTDPTVPSIGAYWFDVTNNLLKSWTGVVWNVVSTATISDVAPATPINGSLWFDTSLMELKQYNASLVQWDVIPAYVWEYEPTNPPACSVWWNTTLDTLNVRDVLTSSWTSVSPSDFIQSSVDPSLAMSMTLDDVWFNTSTNELFSWDGSQWIEEVYIQYLTNPINPTLNEVWFNTSTGNWFVWTGVAWNAIVVQSLASNPYAPALNTFWYDTSGPSLKMWNGLGWVAVSYTTTDPKPDVGDQYFDTLTNTLMEWDGSTWVPADLIVTASFNADGDIQLTSGSTGSTSMVYFLDTQDYLFNQLQPYPLIKPNVPGSDGVSGVPSYKEVGIGSDGSPDERRKLVDDIRARLGYPSVDVELTKYQFDQCIDRALKELRKRSTVAYKRGFMFITLQPFKQQYVLDNKTVGFNKIVNMMAVYRVSASAFGPGSVHPAYQQLMLQYLYQSGKYDLVSYHIVNEYVETLNHMFANDIAYHWDEASRVLTLHQVPKRYEKILLDVTVERTEQELMKHRSAGSWIEQWAYAEAMTILSQIRGKFASLPGAGGGTSLNADSLYSAAEELKVHLLEDIDNYVVDDTENIVGMQGQFLIG